LDLGQVEPEACARQMQRGVQDATAASGECIRVGRELRKEVGRALDDRAVARRGVTPGATRSRARFDGR